MEASVASLGSWGGVALHCNRPAGAPGQLCASNGINMMSAATPATDPRLAAEALAAAYYAAFNAGDRAAMCALLSPDVTHDVNQGERRTGLAAFKAFMAQMDAA